MSLVLTGFLTGIVGGMGLGGGVILIPVLTALFDFSQKAAQYINLLYFVPAALCALFVHFKEGRLELRTAFYMSAGGIIGALAGSELALILSMDILRRIFGVFLFFVGINQYRNSKK